jgi:hypothetical protein
MLTGLWSAGSWQQQKQQQANRCWRSCKWSCAVNERHGGGAIAAVAGSAAPQLGTVQL